MRYILFLERFKETIEYLLRKHPKYIPIFNKFKDIDFERLSKLYDKLNTYRELYDFKDIERLNTYEQVDDFISKLIIDKQKKDYVYQFISNKYKNLINDETIELFDLIRKEIGSDRSKINDLVVKKLAIYKSNTDLNTDLKTILTNLTGDFTVESVIKKYKLPIIFKDNRVVIYDIQSYKDMCKIKNNKWCIVRDKSSFYTYFIKRLTKQYVILDTLKPLTDSLHMIGVTINPNGGIKAIHDSNDNNLKITYKALDIYPYFRYLLPEDKDIVKEYIGKHIGYDVEKIFRYGLTDYFIKCVERGHIDPSAKDNYAIKCAAECGHLDVVRYLCELPIERGIDPSVANNYAIGLAAQYGHLDVVKYLCELPIERGIVHSADYNYAIRFAAYNGHLDVVKYLCELPSVDPSAVDNFAIKWARRNDHLDVVKYLLSIDSVRNSLPKKDLYKYESMIR